MSDSTQGVASGDVEDLHVKRLMWFVIRARRVEEHSLAASKDRLVNWASAKGFVRYTERDSRPELVWNLPDEEPLDSLAARCRPFVLNNDSVYHAKVLNSIGYFVRLDATLTEHVKNLKRAWQKLDASTPGPLGYASRAASAGGLASEIVTDKELAHAWLYGDLVHADEIPADMAAHDIDDRFRGGVLLICNIAMSVIATLNLLRIAQREGLIALSEELFSRRVNASATSTLEIDKMVTAPVGTSIEELDAMLESMPEPVVNLAVGDDPA